MQNEVDELAAASEAEGWRSAVGSAWSKDWTSMTDLGAWRGRDAAESAVAQAEKHAAATGMRTQVLELTERGRAVPSRPVATYEDEDFAN